VIVRWGLDLVRGKTSINTRNSLTRGWVRCTAVALADEGYEHGESWYELGDDIAVLIHTAVDAPEPGMSLVGFSLWGLASPRSG
jgi:hypothetical protein